MESLAIRPILEEGAFAYARAIRKRVFIEEQACPPELEWDEFDPPSPRWTEASHLAGTVSASVIAVSRWRIVDFNGEPAAKLERFAVLPECRGLGYGRQMVAGTIADARAAGHSRFVLHAQTYLVAFYESFGFKQTGGEFDEAGIEHVKMVLNDPE